jgi:hypothetical protein
MRKFAPRQQLLVLLLFMIALPGFYYYTTLPLYQTNNTAHGKLSLL